MQVPSMSHIAAEDGGAVTTGRPLDGDPPEDFVDMVRDALIGLYDARRLKSHRLLAALEAAEPGSPRGAAALRRALLDAIETVNPGPGVSALSRAWRLYRIMELRYVEGREVHDVMDELALSKSQYHRDHHHALQTVAAALWERCAPAQDRGAWLASSFGADLARREAELLRTDTRGGAIDPASVLADVRQLLRPVCSLRQVELRLDLPAELPTIRGDRVALRHALLAILTPAVRALERDVILVEGGTTDGCLTLTLSGATPIVPGKLERALAESAPFVEALGGSLALAAGREPRAWSVILSFPAAARPLLLVVDNSPDFIRLIDRFLGGHGWEVAGAADVDHAYAFALARRPAAILLDIVLPGRDGWALLLELKGNEATRAIPVVVCSVLGEADVAVTLGAAACLHKPVTEAQLLDELRPFVVR